MLNLTKIKVRLVFGLLLHIKIHPMYRGASVEDLDPKQCQSTETITCEDPTVPTSHCEDTSSLPTPHFDIVIFTSDPDLVATAMKKAYNVRQ